MPTIDQALGGLTDDERRLLAHRLPVHGSADYTSWIKAAYTLLSLLVTRHITERVAVNTAIGTFGNYLALYPYPTRADGGTAADRDKILAAHPDRCPVNEDGDDAGTRWCHALFGDLRDALTTLRPEYTDAELTRALFHLRLTVTQSHLLYLGDLLKRNDAALVATITAQR